MTKEVLLTIKGVQKYPGEKPLETITEVGAEYFLRNQSHYIMFEEKQEGFTESVKSMLKIKNNCVELTKKGLIQSHMTFEQNQFYASEYRTPFGSFPMEVSTEELRVLETDNKIIIDIKYKLESGQQPMADCSIRITIREKNAVTH